VTPKSLDYGTVFIGDDLDQHFTITNTGGGTLTGNVSESCPHYSIIAGGGAYALTAGQSVNVMVRFEPTAPGIHNCTVETGTDCDDVACTGIGENPPLCSVSLATVDFDTVLVGSSVDTVFTITNVGGGTLTGIVSEMCDHYTITSGEGPYSLGAGEFVTVTVQYEPAAPGQHLCTIDTGTDCDNVSFIGVGEEPIAVSLGEFKPSWAGDHAEVSWSLRDVTPTAQLSFEVSRAIKRVGHFTRIDNPVIVRDGNQFILKDSSTEPGETYKYQVSILESSQLVASFEVELTIPVSTVLLYQNHPNPFNPATRICFTLPIKSRVTLEVFDVSGKRIKTLVDRTMGPGRHYEMWDGTDNSGNPAASGIYIYRLKAGDTVLSKKCSLLK
jgi:hypothetical protein